MMNLGGVYMVRTIRPCKDWCFKCKKPVQVKEKFVNTGNGLQVLTLCKECGSPIKMSVKK